MPDSGRVEDTHRRVKTVMQGMYLSDSDGANIMAAVRDAMVASYDDGVRRALLNEPTTRYEDDAIAQGRAAIQALGAKPLEGGE